MKDQKYVILNEYEKNLMYCIDLLKDSTTTNIDINSLCKYLFKNLFIGVFSADEMPQLKNGTMCIINTDSSKKSQEPIGLLVINIEIKHTCMILSTGM